MYRNIPTVLTAEEIIDKMFRRSKKVEVPLSKNRLRFHKNLSIAKIYTARDVAVSTLKKYVDSFPYINKLHPFYRTLLDLLVDKNEYKRALASLVWAIEKINGFADKYAHKIKGVGKVEEAIKFRKEFYGRTSSILKQIAPKLEYLGNVRDTIRKLPDINPELPTVVVAGYPNVGKSELVAKLSTAKPEIAPYPFTTKGIVVGHMEIKGKRVQIVDTPGLLDRPLEKRNRIEKEAILALKYLASIIVFILDPSETCGYSMDEQLKLLSEIKKDFNIPIMEVENKVDLLRSDSQRIKISAKMGDGLEGLVDEIVDGLGL